MAETIIHVPCVECGRRVRGPAERLGAKVRCQCEREFIWGPSALRNPIQAPSQEAKSWDALVGAGTLLALFGVAVLLFGGKQTTEWGLGLLGGGLALVIFEALRLRIARARAREHYSRWLQSSEGQRHADYERDISTAREAFHKVEEAARRAAEEERRRELAKKAKDREFLLGLSPQGFEQHVAKLFAALGYKVTLTATSGDEGVDAYLEKRERRALVQCKHRTRGTVSRPDLQQFFGVLVDKKVDEGFFVTTTRFTAQAIEFAKGKPIHLIDLEKLVEMARGAFSEEFIRSGPLGQILGRSAYYRRGWRPRSSWRH